MLESPSQEQTAGAISSSRVEESSPSRTGEAEAVVRDSREEEIAVVPKEKSRSSRRSRRTVNRGLYISPGLRFITRKDLYTFLTSAGVSANVVK